VRADGDLRTEGAGRAWLLSGGVAVRKGVSGLGASDAGSPLLTRFNAKPDAALVRGVGTIQTFVGDFTITGHVQAQYTSSPLLPYEQISLGNLSIGRGYDPAAVLGDSGIAGSLDFRYAALPLHPLLIATPYAFVDAGHVHTNDAAGSGLEAGRTLRSIGAGVVFRIANRANLELTYAHPLDATVAGGGRKNDRLLVQLTASLM
jgi:hemolysin activation/secretion protein